MATFFTGHHSLLGTCMCALLSVCQQENLLHGGEGILLGALPPTILLVFLWHRDSSLSALTHACGRTHARTHARVRTQARRLH